MVDHGPMTQWLAEVTIAIKTDPKKTDPTQKWQTYQTTPITAE